MNGSKWMIQLYVEWYFDVIMYGQFRFKTQFWWLHDMLYVSGINDLITTYLLTFRKSDFTNLRQHDSQSYTDVSYLFY